MREYLFRGKRTDTKEWIYGSLLQWPDGDCYICAPQIENEMSKVQVIPDSVGEFSGMSKDAAKIFEGDLIALGKYLYEVKFEDGKFVGYHVKNKDWGRWGDIKRLFDIDFLNTKWEIAGNIHDNPELLTTTTNT